MSRRISYGHPGPGDPFPAKKMGNSFLEGIV